MALGPNWVVRGRGWRPGRRWSMDLPLHRGLLASLINIKPKTHRSKLTGGYNTNSLVHHGYQPYQQLNVNVTIMWALQRHLDLWSASSMCQMDDGWMGGGGRVAGWMEQ